MPAKGTALPGSCRRGGGRDGGCSPLLSPSPSEARWGWGQEIQFHRSPRAPSEHQRLVGHPGPLLPGTTIQGTPG